MMTETQKAARLELIKSVAEKRKKRAAFRLKLELGAKNVRRWTDVEEKPRRKAREDKIDQLINQLDDNHNHWTDAESYAETHYGTVARNTLKEWD